MLEIGGRRVEVGDNFKSLSPDEQQRTVDEIASSFGQQAEPQAQPEQPGFLQSAGEAISDFGNQFKSQGLTLGFGDELFGALNTPVEMAVRAYTGADAGKGLGERIGNAYAEGRDFVRANDDAARERSPIASTLGEVAGGVLTGGGAAKAGLTLLNAGKASIPGMLARGAGEGAAYGAVHGFGTGEGLDDSINRSVMGGAVGGVTGSAVGGLAGALARRGAAKAATSVDDLKNQAHALYDTAKNSGVVIKPQTYQQAVAGVTQDVKSAGFHPRIHPKVAAALDELSEAANGPVDLSMVDQLRRITGSAAKSIEPDERRIASIMIDKIDDYVDALGPNDVIGPDPTVATKAISEARGLWSRARKAETIEGIIESAKDTAGQYSQSGMENALRTGFRQLAKNPKRMRGFTKAEQAAIKKVSRGGPVENAMRLLGKFAPRGVVSAALSGGIGYTAGGPVGSAALFGVGEIGKRAAGAMTRHNADIAAALMRSGGRLPTPRLSGPQDALIKALMAGTSQRGDALTGMIP
jgi:plasmid stabilization system protein ParE